jgi:hypothetical protein
MAKVKKVKEEVPLTNAQKLEKSIGTNISGYSEIPDAVYIFSVGEKVYYGNHSGCEIEWVSDDKKQVVVSYEIWEKIPFSNGEKVLSEDRNYIKLEWYRVEPIPEKTAPRFSKESRTFHHVMSSTISGVISKNLYFGLNSSPVFQRDYVWTDEDRERLIESILDEKDIGKFVFLKRPYPHRDVVIDGKQRITTITDFYLGKFKFKGYFYWELSFWDKKTFDNLLVSVISLDEKTPDEVILSQFIDVNYTGVPQEKSHIVKVQKMLDDVRSGKEVDLYE